MNNFYDVLRKGRRLYTGQKYRCKKDSRNSYYRDIRVEYSLDEFLYWFIPVAKTANLAAISIGRIDHSENYKLGNIELQTKSENSKEVHRRLGNTGPWKTRRVVITDKNGNETVADSLSEAARLVSYDASTISKFCNGKRNGSRNRTGFTFKYQENSI